MLSGIGSIRAVVPECSLKEVVGWALRPRTFSPGKAYPGGDFMRKNQSGFSLIELLLVVAIILIIAAIAVPNYVRSRMRANEAPAVASLRVID